MSTKGIKKKINTASFKIFRRNFFHSHLLGGRRIFLGRKRQRHRRFDRHARPGKSWSVKNIYCFKNNKDLNDKFNPFNMFFAFKNFQ